MKLYWYWSFNPQKVRLALEELGLAYDVEPVDLIKGEQRTDAYGEVHPRNRVPALEDEGIVFWESNAILVYLGEKTGKLWPQSAADKAEATRWFFFEARHLSESIGRVWFNDYVMAQIGREGDSSARDAAAENLPGELAVVERQLGDNDFMLGADFSLVDCCYGAVLDALSLSNYDLGECGNIRAYLDRVRERSSWAACEFKS